MQDQNILCTIFCFTVCIMIRSWHHLELFHVLPCSVSDKEPVCTKRLLINLFLFLQLWCANFIYNSLWAILAMLKFYKNGKQNSIMVLFLSDLKHIELKWIQLVEYEIFFWQPDMQVCKVIKKDIIYVMSDNNPNKKCLSSLLLLWLHPQANVISVCRKTIFAFGCPFNFCVT